MDIVNNMRLPTLLNVTVFTLLVCASVSLEAAWHWKAVGYEARSMWQLRLIYGVGLCCLIQCAIKVWEDTRKD